MNRITVHVLGVWLALLAAVPALAQATASGPTALAHQPENFVAAPDATPLLQSGVPDYFDMVDQSPREDVEPSVYAQPVADEQPAMPAYLDSHVAQAVHTVESQPEFQPADQQLAQPVDLPGDTYNQPAEHDARRLVPPSEQSPAARGSGRAAADWIPAFGLPLDSIYTTGSALAIVLGLFLLCTWTLRRGARKPTGALPQEVVTVLGRTPLAARQFAELVRVGNKLLLVSVTPTGAETLTEVTDPLEVDRLLGLCEQQHPHSTTAAFDRVLRQLAKEPASDGFLGAKGQFFSTDATGPGGERVG